MTIASLNLVEATSEEPAAAKPAVLACPVRGFTAPNILLWSVIFWENYINLNFNAPYTETYLTAPILIAALKVALLAALAFIFEQLTKQFQKTGVRFSLFRPLLVCWLMSTLTWAVYIIAMWQALVPAQRDKSWSPTDYLAQFLYSTFDGWPTYARFIWTYAAESFIFLCIGWGVIATLSASRARLKPQRGNSDPQAVAITVQQAIFTVLLYSFCNGIFEFLIRA
jgi:hypothetical protein